MRDHLDRNTVLPLKNIGELIKATAEAQEGLGKVSTMVMEAESRASHFGFKISADGTTVTDPNPIKKSFGDLISPWDTDHEEDKKEREKHLEECKVHVRNARKKADEADRAYEAALPRIAGGKVKSSGRLEDPNPGLSKQPPSNNTEEVAAWWAAHTDAEKQALAEESPEMVGNLDGVKAKYRNIANRKLLNKDLQQYKPVADRLEQLKRANPGKSESQLLSRDELLQLKYYREAKNTESRSRRSAGWGTTLRRRRGKAIRARASRSGIIPFSAPATPGWAATAERSSWRESGIRATRRLRERRASTSRSLATRTDRRRPVTPPRRHGPG